MSPGAPLRKHSDGQHAAGQHQNASEIPGRLRFHLIHKLDAIVLGAGAAGLMCAIEAGKRGRRVAVLERLGNPDSNGKTGIQRFYILRIPFPPFLTLRVRGC